MPIQEWVKRRNIERIVFTKRQATPTAAEREAAWIALGSDVMTYNDLLHVTQLDNKD